MDRESYNAYHRAYYRKHLKEQREYKREYNRKWGKKYGYPTQDKWIKSHPEARSAQQKVWQAKRKGIIKVEPCEKCGNVNVVLHHDDYSKPLQVRFLCHSCHRKIHYTRVVHVKMQK